jgi:hypothetical protein
MHTLSQVAFVNKSWNDMGIFQVAGCGINSMDNKTRRDGVTYKLSCGPKIFVGIPEVKLHPNSSLYALHSYSQ